MHQLSDESLADLLPVAKKIALALQESEGSSNMAYNILQNNGKLAHQEVEHVHFHLIPKKNSEEGLGLIWNSQKADMSALKQLAERIAVLLK